MAVDELPAAGDVDGVPAVIGGEDGEGHALEVIGRALRPTGDGDRRHARVAANKYQMNINVIGCNFRRRFSNDQQKCEIRPDTNITSSRVLYVYTAITK